MTGSLYFNRRLTLLESNEYYDLADLELLTIKHWLELLDNYDNESSQHQWVKFDPNTQTWCQCPLALLVDAYGQIAGKTFHDLWECSNNIVHRGDYIPTEYTKNLHVYRLGHAVQFPVLGTTTGLWYLENVIDAFDELDFDYKDIASCIRNTLPRIITMQSAKTWKLI